MAGFSGFKVGISIFLLDQASRGLMGITRSIASATGASRALRAELAGIQTSMRIGMGMTMIGGAGLGLIGKAVKDAAEFQINMVRVANMFKLSTDQARLFKNELFEISHRTMFSAENIQDVALGMKNVGINFENISKLLPQFSAAAEILFRVSKGGVSPQQTGQVLGEFAHTLGVYDPKGLARLSNVLVNAAQLIPGGAQGLITQLGYLRPAQLMGIPPGNLTPQQTEEFQVRGGIKMVELSALAQQIVGGRGSGARGPASGAAMLNFLMGAAGVGTTLTGFGFIQNQLGRAALGFLDPATGKSPAMASGALDIWKEVQTAQAAFNQARTLQGQQQMVRRMVQEMSHAHMTLRQVTTIMNAPMIKGVLAGQVQNPGALVDMFEKFIGGQTGMRFAATVSAPGTVTAMQNLVKSIEGGASIAEQQQKFLDTLPGRWAQLTTDIHNVSIEIGTTLLPILTRWVVSIDSVVEKFRIWIEAHPVATKRLTELAAAISGLTLAGGVAISLLAVGRALRIIAGIGGFGSIAGAIVTALTGPTALIIGGAIAAGFIAWMITKWTGLGGPDDPLAKLHRDAEKDRPKTMSEWWRRMVGPSTPIPGAFKDSPEYEEWRKRIHPFGTPAPVPAHKSPSAYFGRPFGGGIEPAMATGGVTIAPGAIHIEVHGDIAGDSTIEKLRRELHAALLSFGSGGGVTESTFAHGAASI